MTFTYVFSGCFSPIIGSTLYENLDFVRATEISMIISFIFAIIYLIFYSGFSIISDTKIEQE